MLYIRYKGQMDWGKYLFGIAQSCFIEVLHLTIITFYYPLVTRNVTISLQDQGKLIQPTLNNWRIIPSFNSSFHLTIKTIYHILVTIKFIIFDKAEGFRNFFLPLLPNVDEKSKFTNKYFFFSILSMMKL